MKRKLEEFDLCNLKECRSAIVHGVVTELSPVKRSKRDDVKYFRGGWKLVISGTSVIAIIPA